IEVMGPNQPLTPGDVPVISNSVAQVQYVPGIAGFVIETWNGSAWVEQGRVTFWCDFPHNTRVKYDELVAARANLITTERSVGEVTIEATGTKKLVDVYITLQRGWNGLRFEAYAGYPDHGVAIRYVPNVFSVGLPAISFSSGPFTWAVSDWGNFVSID